MVPVPVLEITLDRCNCTPLGGGRTTPAFFCRILLSDKDMCLLRGLSNVLDCLATRLLAFCPRFHNSTIVSQASKTCRGYFSISGIMCELVKAWVNAEFCEATFWLKCPSRPLEISHFLQKLIVAALFFNHGWKRFVARWMVFRGVCLTPVKWITARLYYFFFEVQWSQLLS